MIVPFGTNVSSPLWPQDFKALQVLHCPALIHDGLKASRPFHRCPLNVRTSVPRKTAPDKTCVLYQTKSFDAALRLRRFGSI